MFRAGLLSRARTVLLLPDSVAPLVHPQHNVPRHFSSQIPRKTTFKRTKPGQTSARAPRSSTATNIVTFLAASSIGVGAYLYQWNNHREGSIFSSLTGDADNGLSTEKWTPVLLRKVTPVSEHTSLFDFELQKPCVIPISSAIYVKDDEIQAMRAYTPVHSLEREQSSFQLLIKRYSEGQVSRFMHSARPGQKVEMRGPVLIWPGSRSDLAQWDEIGMIAGGTGITALLPIIHSALTHPDKKIKISLLFAAQVPEELYFRDELEQLAKTFHGQLRVAYTVDKVTPSPTAAMEGEWKDNVGYVSEYMLRGLLPTPKSLITDNKSTLGDDVTRDSTTTLNATGKSIVLICGPESMVKHVAGTRGVSGQDPIRGVLGTMGYQNDQVFRFPN
ncbi:hypothetical protein EDD11_010379 [Mortierella claussenii]|nr:hypothetical protein EDD11_010379 [Mortierella claussenii]